MQSALSVQIQQLAACVAKRSARRNRGTESQIEAGRLNESAVLAVIEKHGPMSRREIAKKVGMTKETVGKHVGNLARQGLVSTTRYSVEVKKK